MGTGEGKHARAVDSGFQPCSHPILDFKLGTGPAWVWGVSSRPQG